MLVGRDQERGRLAADLEAARAGRGSAAAVIGEPGIGKTALVVDLAARAGDAGMRVLWGRCSDLTARAEWESIAQALGALFDDGTVDAALATRCGGGLLAVVPEAAQVAPELVPPAGADQETIEFAVARATTRLLRHVCLQRPHVLVIDDVRDADAASLRLLARLAREARTMKVFIVMTAREAELGARQNQTEVAELTRDLVLVRVGALDRAAGDALIRHVAPALPPATVERVLSAGEGNPLYLSELAALLASRTVSGGEELPIPVGIKASIRSRLDRLPREARAFVEALAVLGGHAPIEAVAAVAGVAVTAARLAFERGIVVAVGTKNVRTSHALVRDVAYDLVGSERTALHRRAADPAARRVAAGDHGAAVELVRHLVACGAAGEAIDAAIVAARAAIVRAADDEAVSLLEVAGADVSAVDDRRRAELEIALGRALLRSGRSEEGVAACTRATALAETLGDADLAAHAALARGSVFRFGHVDRGLVAALGAALVARGAREDAIHARLLARLAAAEQPSLHPWDPIKRAHEAFALARRLGDDHVMLDVLHDGMAALIDFEDPRVRSELNRELVVLARKMRASWYELRALSRLVFDHTDLGEAAEADAVIDDLDRVARSFAHPRHQWRVAMVRAMRASSCGQWLAADRYLDESVALGSDDPGYKYAQFGHRFARLRAQERAEELVQLIEDPSSPMLDVAEFSSLDAVLRANAYARAGLFDRARDQMPHARDCLPFEDVGFTVLMAEAAATLGDRESCALVEPRLVGWKHRFASGGPMFMYVADPVERTLDLADDNDGTIDRGDAGEVLDARARSEYRARLVDVREDLADAERRGDLGWIERLRSEAETIQAELARAFALGGRARRAGAAAERARSAVTRRVREAIARIAEHDPVLGDHLAWAIRTGMTCRYRVNRS